MSIGANSYGSVQSILRNGLDRAFRADPALDDVAVTHGNIRGADYYH